MKTLGYRAFTCASLLTLAACGSSDESAVGDDAVSDGSDPASDVVPEAPTPGVPSVSERVARIEERLAATNAHDWDTWQALHTPDALRTAPELEQPIEGALAMRAAIEALSTAFPDYRLELRQAFGQGEWLAIRLHTTGTMTGPLSLSDGTLVPPTGQPIDQDWAALVRFQGDRIAEFHEFYDQLLLMEQLGLVTP